MENKQNFAGIIIPVIVAVILLTVLPIINSMNVECPPCEECPSYNIGNVEVNPDFSSGDYTVDKGSYDYLDSVTIIKDDNLIPENIKKDVNIFGVVGTYEVLLPTLYAPTISISDDTLTITPNSNNGAFVTGYKIYVDDVLDDVLLDTTTSTTYDLSEKLTEVGTYVIYVTAFATGFIDSEHSNMIDYVIESEPIYPTNVVVFKSDSPRTITPKYTNTGITLQYSTNGGTTWTNISNGGTTTSSDEIWFRGRATATKRLYIDNTTSNAWVFSGNSSNKLHVYGDLRYLLCDNLGDNNIIFNISDYCFSNMFRDCTSLTTAPSLPATTLANDCYSDMFRGCTSLTTAPSLPATILADGCYTRMFYGCTSLTTAPSLPATILADSCYARMFYGCTSLTTAPSLPATTLAERCYYYMFYGCTAFKVSTTKTGSYQYSWRIPTSGTGTTAEAEYWNANMLENTGGTYTDNPTINTTYYVENPPV